MTNPNPVQTEDFKRHWYKPQGEVTAELSKKAIAVKLPIEVDKAIRALPQSAAWLRQVITEAAQRELIKDGEL
jgi:threonine synthase